MENHLKYYENIPLSDKDILNLLNNRVNIEVYPNLHKYQNIDELLGPYEACVILFESKPNYGHWCCVFKINDDLIEFFNPYGSIKNGFPDDCLLHIPTNFRKESHQYVPYLSLLLLNSPYELSYNEYELQQHNNNIKTCGRHCVVRLWNKNLTLDEYIDNLNRDCENENLNYDQLVTLITI